ncbi:hypothetical protein [Sulfurovum sp.]|uniref:hypothetical protein n=1 Tax=Sulfurovum sp. TaxID=1969726 RepID=UPI0025E8ACED|nr:hypothetical protein [Sulfurovum sp.]
MKKQIKKMNRFARHIGKGLHIEFKETAAIPSLLKDREYKKAGEQVLDIARMVGLSVIWVIPGGAVITAMIVKFSHKSRPSAFRTEKIIEEETDISSR